MKSNPYMHIFIGYIVLFVIVSSTDESAPPKIIQSPGDVYGLQNQQVSLRCESADPTDRITWIKDDRPIEVDSARFVFQLNFESEGYYLCNVSNKAGWVTSERAHVRVAYLHPFPHQNRSNQYASPGSTVLLHCPTIDGLPLPNIDWQSNTSLSDPRFRLDSDRNLRIDLVQPSDSVLFWCRAKNLAFTRISSTIHLIVLQKPVFHLLPKNFRVLQGSSVLLPCLVTGAQPLLVIWHKISPSPSDTSLSQAALPQNCSLLLTNVRLHHTGSYIARASNQAGITEIVFHLSVISPPSILVSPDDSSASLGSRILLPCQASGVPPPRIFWQHGNDYLVPLPDGGSIGHLSRVSIFDNGTLLITSLRSKDSGIYRCYAASVVGVSRSQCSVTVDVPSNMFPPIIYITPSNVIAVEGATAVLTCRTHEPTAVISWYKQSLRIMGLDRPRGRFHLLKNGDLKIRDLHIQDSASYTCRASIGVLYSERSAHLTVKSLSEGGSDLIVRSKVDPSTAAANISVEFVGDTYILLKWKASLGRQVITYHVEASAQFVSGWKEVGVSKELKLLITGLKPDTGYKLLVRSAGGSVSVLNEVIYTLDKPSNAGDLTFVDFHKALQEIEIFSVKPSSASSNQIFVSWKVRGGSILESVSGFVIKAEPVSVRRCLLMSQKLGDPLFSCLNNDNDDDIEDLLSKYDDKDFQVTVPTRKVVIQRTIHRDKSKVSAIIGDLKPFVCYEVEIETFIDHVKAGRISGRDSAAKTVLTYDDIPSKAPTVRSYRWLSNRTFFLSWDKLSNHYSNGPITGYIVQLINLNNKSLLTFKVSANILEYQLKIESPQHRHIVYLSANSCRGQGPRSWPVLIQDHNMEMSNYESVVVRKPHVIAFVVGGTIIGLLLVIVFISVLICRKRRSGRNHLKLGMIPLVSSTDKNIDNSIQKQKKNDKLAAQNLLSNYETLSPHFINSSDGFLTEHGSNPGPRFACCLEEMRCIQSCEGASNDSLAYASSSVIYKGCQHYNQALANRFPPNFYGPYIDILNDQRSTSLTTTDSSLILNPLIPPPPLYPPPPAPKNQRNCNLDNEGVPSSHNTHSSSSASACGSSNKSNKTRKSRTPQSINQSINSSSSSKSQKNWTKAGRPTNNPSHSSPSMTGDYKKKDSISNSTHSSQKTGPLSYQGFIVNSNSTIQVREDIQDDKSEAVFSSEVSDTDTAPRDLEAEEEARDTDSLRVMYKLPVKRPPSPDYSTDSSYPYSLANHYSTVDAQLPTYPSHLPTKF